MNEKPKLKFGFFYDLNKYSLKELIANYLVMFGWVLCVIIEIINCCVHKQFIKDFADGKVVARPIMFDRLSRFAFVFLALTFVGGILKIIWMTKRRKGKLLSYYETFKSNFQNADKKKASKVLIGIYIAIGIFVTTIVMLAVWYF